MNEDIKNDGTAEQVQGLENMPKSFLLTVKESKRFKVQEFKVQG